MAERRLTHVDSAGGVRMVDVGAKDVTSREATAEGSVRCTGAAIEALRSGSPKGDVLATARIAGVMAAKRTAELIPLCHPLPLDHIDAWTTHCPVCASQRPCAPTAAPGSRWRR
jgi:cyclic pyranopterin monophosphate synthase